MRLSTNFTLDTFTKSNTATRKGIENIPDGDDIFRLADLCQNVLEPLRSKLNSDLIISSGYRSIALNKAIGGSKNSQHCIGEATDLEVLRMSTKALYEFIKKSGIEFDQLLREYSGPNPSDGWVHVSYRKGNNRKECFIVTKVNGKTVYTKDN